jgi:hypothetical protein
MIFEIKIGARWWGGGVVKEWWWINECYVE